MSPFSQQAAIEVAAEMRDALRDLEAEVGLHAKRVAEAADRIERQLRRIDGTATHEATGRGLGVEP